MLGATLEAIVRIKLGGDEGVEAVLSGGYIEGDRDYRKDGSKYLEDS